MKKQHYLNRTLLLIGICGIAHLGFAQISEEKGQLGEAYAVPDNVQEIKETYLKNKRVENQWFDYIDDARTTLAEQYTYFTGSWQWEDSLPIKPFDAGPEHNGTHGGGMVLDLNSDFWVVNQQGKEWSRHTRYTLDSIYIPFKYRNFSDATDSLVISFFDPTAIDDLTWTSNQAPTYSVTYEPSTHSFPNSTQSTIYYLDSSMNTTNFYSTDYSTYVERGIDIPVGMSVSPLPGDPEFGNLFAVTVQFFGVNQAALGDTMKYRDSLDQNPNNISLFSLLNMRGNNSTYSDPSMNYGLYIFGNQRYNTNATTWAYPYNPPNSEKLFNYTLFKVTGQNVGINEVNKHVSFALSPNPIHASQVMHADFQVDKPSEVRIGISDLNGKEIQVLANGFYAPGEHLIDADISALSPGMYLYTVTTNSGSLTKKFVVK